MLLTLDVGRQGTWWTAESPTEPEQLVLPEVEVRQCPQRDYVPLNTSCVNPV